VANKLCSAVAAAAFAIGALALSAPAQADEAGVKAGILTCNVSSGWGFIFGSTRDLRCTYSHDHGALEQYVGHINKFGVDIGYQAGGVIVWAVFAPSADVGKGALAGEYGGATGGAAVGVGATANVLIGGFQKSFTLQPVSIEGNTGLNVAAGIAQVTLRHQN
jgi:hypothetical protein